MLTGPAGDFHIEHLQSGLYQVTAAGTIAAYRLWTPTAAPPGALAAVLVVSAGDTVRGQKPIGGYFRSDAFLITVTVVGAIAIPVAIFSSRRESPPGS